MEDIGGKMKYRNILYDKDHHVVTITLNRPHVHNCLSAADGCRAAPCLAEVSGR
jgi:enoyl-CoA hydratase/carnithine racemase